MKRSLVARAGRAEAVTIGLMTFFEIESYMAPSAISFIWLSAPGLLLRMRLTSRYISSLG